MTGFLGAVQFLTILPVRLRGEPRIEHSVPFFPTVGALIGVTVGLVAAGAMELVPAGSAAAIAVVTGAVLTGAFHEDGLADTADALGGQTQQRRLEILKDSRHGSFGVVALVSTLLLRVTAVASLGPAAAFGGLVAAHALARSGAVSLMLVGRPATTAGLGSDYVRNLNRAGAAVGALAGVGFATAAIGWWAAPALIAVAVGTALIGWLATRFFGGFTGDLLGAAEQVGECVCLITVAGLAARHDIWWS